MFATSSSSVTVPTLVVPHSSTVPPLSTCKTPHNSSKPIINRRHLLTISISISVTTPFTQSNSLSPPVADARGLFQMPPFRLTNRYFLVRAGESEYESLGIINTNPVAKTSMDSGLSEKGKKQIVRAAFELKAMGACEKGCWIWPSITQRAYQAAEIIASVNGVSRSYIVPEYSFLDARGLGAYEGKNLESISEVYASDGISTTIKPPPIDDGTPNESVADVFVRVTQLMSILETQYSGDTVIIVSPDSDNLTILQAGLVGLDLRRHRDLSFAPGEVRFVDTKSIPTYKQPASAVYKCYNPPNLHGIWFILLSCHCSSKVRGSETCYMDLNFVWTILFTSLWQLAVSISPMNLFRARNAGPSCLVWNLWRERNRRMFDDQELFMENFKSEFVELLFYWMLFFDVSRPPMVFSFRKSLHCYLISLILITWYMF